MSTIRRNWEAERNEKWFMKHSEQRRREILARRDEVVKMALNCSILESMLLIRIDERKAFLVACFGSLAPKLQQDFIDFIHRERAL